MELLRKLSEATGASGREDVVREIIVAEMKTCMDEVTVDSMGSVIGVKKSAAKNPKKVMVCAHMDEIGFIVSHIDKNGFIRFVPVGGFDPRVLLAQRVIVHGKQPLHGIIGSKPIHILDEAERNKTLQLKDLFIDTCIPKKSLEKIVEIGNPVTIERQFIEFGDKNKFVCCKAFDDRVGVYVMLKTVQALKKADVDVYAVASVQEEVGLRGAQTTSFAIQPDIGVALDVTLANDMPGVGEHDHISTLGGGTAIKLLDSAAISHVRLVEFMRNIAKKKKIKYQMEILPRGGTDSGAIQRSRGGIPVVTISIPTRYVHSSVETAHKDDIDASIKLLGAFLTEAHRF